MIIRPASLYRYVFMCLAAFCVLYGFYNIIAYDDGSHVPVQRAQKHLYLTVSKDRIGSRFDTLAPKRILYWTKVFNAEMPHSALGDCPGLTDRCVIDNEKSQVGSADAVVFHAADLSAQPLPDPSSRTSKQVYVFNSMETPQNSGRFAVPRNFFNWTMTFLFSSTAIHKYGSFWIPTSVAESRGFKVQSYYVNPQKLKKPRSGIFGLVSNCDTPSKREVALEELAKHMNVTIGGKCAKTESLRTICPQGQDCLDLFAAFPFYVAIENTVCTDYVSEKFWNRVSVPSVPIVMSRRVYEKTFPPKSFIAMDDYKNAKEMANHLIELENNATAYAEYFAWRNKGEWTTAPWNSPGYRNGVCRVCELLWQNTTNNVYTIPEVWNWFDNEARCEKDEIVQGWLKNKED